MKKWIVKKLNSYGLFTLKQHCEVLEQRDAAKEYAHYLEKSVNGMADPAKPIIVIGEYTRVTDISLQHGQQIIVSPFAKFTDVRNVYTLPAAAQQKQGGE